MNPLLTAKGLSLEISGRRIFSIDELSLERGEALALVGPNGAGKSSLLRTLALLQAPTAGTLTFDGERPYQTGNLVALRRRMALVFQEALLLDATVESNMTIPLRIRGISRRDALSRAGKWLERFGISHLANRSSRRLSGGEAQRASLARAFAMEPQLLFLDEPFSALDYPTRKSLLEDMGKLLKDMNQTTLFVTHDYTEIPYLSSSVAVLFEGRIAKKGSIREVFGEELALSQSH
jgi:tungstate transport system ATP-binding protein